ncbi:Protein of unknown function (DUF1644 [Striga hermonthica]|uniref:Uncharacterized protein n=1 Tax=Striga hermonthica TaxID=68872 RepID=A0A9N7MHT8_STRHE|nr:Protein of unknown function (DUF1644 [Striga hermonthica]
MIYNFKYSPYCSSAASGSLQNIKFTFNKTHDSHHKKSLKNDKPCRPYMCGTSSRYSNCLDQYHKASAKVSSATELICPLCRGQVMGWTVVEPAREHLNAKRRGCIQDAKSPSQERWWRRFEWEREREDVMSTICSSTLGAVFFGDYVIEGGNDWMSKFLGRIGVLQGLTGI